MVWSRGRQSAFPGTTPLNQINHAHRQKYEKIDNTQKSKNIQEEHFKLRNIIQETQYYEEKTVFVALFKEEV